MEKDPISPYLPEHVREVWQYIQRAGLKPDDLLPGERDLSGKLRISRTKLRDAMNTLEEWGLIERRRRFGTTLKRADPHIIAPLLRFHVQLAVPKPHENDDEITEARAVLESAIAARAATKRTTIDVLEMQIAIESQAAAINDLDAWLVSDRRFHDAVLAAAHNVVMRVVGQVIVASFARKTPPLKVCEGGEISQTILQEHTTIVQHISDGNADLARASMFNHLIIRVEDRMNK